MNRPLRLEFAGALYHVTSRGDRQEDIYRTDADRLVWLDVLEHVCSRYNFIVHSYCQMGNHYHLVVETPEANLSQGMRQLNGNYTQYFNRRYTLTGHLFQGRYKAILVQRGSHLLELTRYVVLNPVRAGLVSVPDQWRWSSHQDAVGSRTAPAWLDTAWLLGQFNRQRDAAVRAYRSFVAAGIGKESPLKRITNQAILGDAQFVEQFQQGDSVAGLQGISRTQRRILVLPLGNYQVNYPNRDEAIARAYFSTAYSMYQISQHFGVSQSTVRRAIQAWDKNLSNSN
jgi:REP element-mobilizing transposase RayT